MEEDDLVVDLYGRWECRVCTLINDGGDDGVATCCRACETPRLLNAPWTCRYCTLINQSALKRCDACGKKRKRRRLVEGEGAGHGQDTAPTGIKPHALRREKPSLPATAATPTFLPSHTVPMYAGCATGEGEDEDDDEDLRTQEAFARSLFDEFVLPIQRKASSPLKCLCCGKIHSTRRIMTMHFVKMHLGVFNGSFDLENDKALRALRTQADEAMAHALQRGENGLPGENEEGITAEMRHEESTSQASPARLPGGRREKEERTHMRKRRLRMTFLEEEEESEKDESEEEESEEEESDASSGAMGDGSWDGVPVVGPTTRAGTTLVYQPRPPSSYSMGPREDGEREGGRAGGPMRPVRESEREMEERKRKRLALLMERTREIRSRLEQGIASLRAAAGEGGGKEGGKGNGEAEEGQRSRALLLCGRTLRGHQEQGLSWLLSLHRNGLNGILADEMVG